MSNIKFLKRYAEIQVQALRNPKEQVVIKPGPLGIRPGCGIEIDLVPIILALDLANLKPFDRTQTVVAVGKMVEGNLTTYRAYFEDGQHFVQFVVDAGAEILEMRLYQLRIHAEPATKDEVDFLLNAVDGYIGLAQFQIPSDKEPEGQAVFARRRDVGNPQRIEPVSLKETLTATNGDQSRVEHQTMTYGRVVTEDGETANEYLIVALTEDHDSVDFTVHVGIDLAPGDVKFL